MEVLVQKTCIICNRAFDWHQVAIVKLPEGTTFCLDCSEKHRDNNVYKGPEGWGVIEYEPGDKFIYD